MYLHALKNVDEFNSENKMFEFVKIINTNTQRYFEISQALLWVKASSDVCMLRLEICTKL